MPGQNAQKIAALSIKKLHDHHMSMSSNALASLGLGFLLLTKHRARLRFVHASRSCPRKPFISYRSAVDQVSFPLSLLDKRLDTLEPAEVLLLLLHIDVVGDEHGEMVVDAASVEVALEDALDFFVELSEWWASVGALWVGAEQLDSVASFCVGHLCELLNHEVAIRCNQIELESTLVLALDKDLDTNWESWLLVVLLDGY